MGIISLKRHKMATLIFVTTLVGLIVCPSAYGSVGRFSDEFEPTFGGHRVRVSGRSNQLLSLSLDKYSGSGFRSKQEYLYGRVDMQVKLVGGNSAGTVTTLYVSLFLPWW